MNQPLLYPELDEGSDQALLQRLRAFFDLRPRAFYSTSILYVHGHLYGEEHEKRQVMLRARSEIDGRLVEGGTVFFEFPDEEGHYLVYAYGYWIEFRLARHSRGTLEELRHHEPGWPKRDSMESEEDC